MQALSSMQRNSSDLLSLRFILFCFLLVGYEITTAATHILPPLIGLFFSYLIILKHESEKNISNIDKRWYLVIFFLIFAEQIHGFELFSTILAFIIFYYFINDWLRINMKWRQMLLVIFVFSGYIGTFIASNIILYILNQPMDSMSYEYFIYIAIESLISIALFKERVL